MNRVYFASPGFNMEQRMTQVILEKIISENGNVEYYFPLTMGTKLKSEDFNSEAALTRVFNENISRLEWCDFLVANLEDNAIHDTGTLFEVGYALGRGIPIVMFSTFLNPKKSKEPLYTDIDIKELKLLLSLASYQAYDNATLNGALNRLGNKSFIERTKLQIPCSNQGVSSNVLLEKGQSLKHFKQLVHMTPRSFILQIDDRPILGSVLMGYYYAKGVPVITYAEDPKISCNVMLLGAVRTHVRGREDLNDLMWVLNHCGGIQKVKQSSLAEFKDVPTT